MALTTALTRSARELLTALTVGEGAFFFEEVCGWKVVAAGGAAVERTPKYLQWVKWGSGASV